MRTARTTVVRSFEKCQGVRLGDFGMRTARTTVARELFRVARLLCGRSRSAREFDAEDARDVGLKVMTKWARALPITRVYDCIAGTPSVCFNLGEGSYSIWFEPYEGKVASEISVRGENHPEVDDIFYDAFDGTVFDDARDVKDAFEEVMDKALDWREMHSEEDVDF